MTSWTSAPDGSCPGGVVDAADTRVVADGLELADGTRHELDVLIFGTGFETREFVAPMAVTGPEGRPLEATGGCPSWYLDDRGRDPTNWPGYTLEYRRRVRRADGETYALGAAR